VAVTLPAEVEAHLAESIDGLKVAHSELRWVPPPRWHLTLEFLGECGPHEIDRQLNRWTVRARRVGPLRLALAGGGAFPKTWRARVFWGGVRVDSESWRRLAHHDQSAHVTLARTRELCDLTGVVDSLSSYVGPEWVADDIALVQSHLRGSAGRGPRYEVLERFRLGSG
jgi:RNA 2',3'-cyclic 3'-phosphodiesterase